MFAAEYLGICLTHAERYHFSKAPHFRKSRTGGLTER